MKESRILEFKSEVTNSFLKTVSAYANFGTGVIQFGIRDDGSICGVADAGKVCLDLENRINDSISPKPDYSLSIDNRTDVITLMVSEGRYKPYLYKGKAYRRSDTASIEVDGLELKRLTLEGSNLYYEELVNEEQELTFSILEAELKRTLEISELTDDMLRTFGFYTKERRYNIAAALFADLNSFSGIDAARFGNSISEILDRETFAGMSVLKQYDLIAVMFKRYYQYEKIEGFERVSVDLIPEAAFREAIANALVHRTWDIRSHIRVSMFSDRVEIVSPGGLPRGITKEEYLNGNISNLRNPILGNLFYRMHYIEMFGTGIKRIKEAYRDCALKPDFEIYENSIVVTLPIVQDTPRVTPDGQKILTLLSGGMQLSAQELAGQLEWSKDKTIRELGKLRKDGYVEVLGTGRATRYAKR